MGRRKKAVEESRNNMRENMKKLKKKLRRRESTISGLQSALQTVMDANPMARNIKDLILASSG
jgi:hypothetical protein